MTFLEKNLRPGERVLYRTGIHWAVFVFPLAAAMAIVPVYYFCYGYFVHDGSAWMEALARLIVNYNGSLTILGILSVIWLMLFGWPMTKGLYKILTSDVIVTNQRIMFKYGLIFTHMKDMQNDRLEGIEIEQSLLGQLFNYGHMRIIFIGMEHTDLYNIADPTMLRSRIILAAAGVGTGTEPIVPRGQSRRVGDELVKAA